MKTHLILIAALTLISSNNVFAQHDGMDMSGMDMSGMSEQKTAIEAVGVVDSVDQSKGLVTLSHEPIASLNWPAMTMDFVVSKKALYKKLVVGKKVGFTFVKQSGRYVLTGVI